jgi:ABC-type long-subunit fatty acid transport system fused permease/ATPase subunit
MHNIFSSPPKQGMPTQLFWMLLFKFFHFVVSMCNSEFHFIFSWYVYASVNNWNKLQAKLITNCLYFNKDAKAYWKKWQQIYKDYKYDKSIKALSWNEKSKDYKWYLLVDEYMFDHPNVIAHVHGKAHEPKGV